MSALSFSANDYREPPFGWLENLARLAREDESGDIDASTVAALYFLGWLRFRYGGAAAARKRKGDSRPDIDGWRALFMPRAPARRDRLLDIFQRYQFRGVIPNVAIALSQWLCGAWRLELREDIPSPRDVLHAQARGVRPVTAIMTYPRAAEPVLRHADGFAFFVHDLEHAHKFFYSPALYQGQRKFFAVLEAALDRGVFLRYFGDAVFVDKFHYAMSDMNTHPEHSRQYLRAILVEYHLRREGKPAHAPLSHEAEMDIETTLREIGSAEVDEP